jgi:hypothetical protein
MRTTCASLSRLPARVRPGTYPSSSRYLREFAHPVPLLYSLLFFSLVTSPNSVREKFNLQRVQLIRRIPETDDEEEEDNQAFLRRFCICEEDRLARTGEMRTGLNGLRWSRSKNIVPIEQARARRNQSQIQTR